MEDKKQLISMLKDEFNRWDALVGGMSAEQAEAANLESGLSIKDVMGHLHAWQARTVARLEAASRDAEPVYPTLPAGMDPNADDVDALNAWFYDTHHNQPWANMYQQWREGYLRFIDLAEALPEEDLMDPQRYAWTEGEPLANTVASSYEHHHEEHLAPLLAQLARDGDDSKKM